MRRNKRRGGRKSEDFVTGFLTKNRDWVYTWLRIIQQKRGKDNGSSAGKDKAKMDGRREAELYFEGIKPLKINRHLYLQLPSVPETVKEQRWKYNTKQWYREIVPRET